jgi:hypothetical protein
VAISGAVLIPKGLSTATTLNGLRARSRVTHGFVNRLRRPRDRKAAAQKRGALA